jgi:cellulose synthase/poly-beta-1,6-N-acetylglucosamine synthase-like glycosyltransferase
MHSFPNVSTIIPIYNGETDVIDLLECLKSQTYPSGQVEYIFIDNNSQDRTFELLKNAAQTTSIKLRILQQKEIQSSYAARNTGIQTATGEILAFTDADCRPFPNWLETLIQPFVNSEIGIVAGEVEAFPSNNFLEKYAQNKEILSQKHTLAHPFCAYGQTANLAIRRHIFQQIGLFRPHLTTGGDADICWRILQQTEWQLEYAPNAIVQHRHRSTLTQLYKQWQRYGESNRYLHELHGIELTREITLSEILYRMSRWLIKELPISCLQISTKKAGFVDIFTTPLDLFCFYARTTGQHQAKLPELAKEIEELQKNY